MLTPLGLLVILRAANGPQESSAVFQPPFLPPDPNSHGQSFSPESVRGSIGLSCLTDHLDGKQLHALDRDPPIQSLPRGTSHPTPLLGVAGPEFPIQGLRGEY